MNNTVHGGNIENCPFHYMLKEAIGQGATWVFIWLLTALLTTMLSLIAILCLLDETSYGHTNRCLKLSMFGSHLLAGLIVLPMLGFASRSRLPLCTHQITLTFSASMTHFVSCMSVMLLSTHIYKRVSQNQSLLSLKRVNIWKLAVMATWTIAPAMAVIPVFLSVRLYVVPILTAALLLTTYRQVKTILCLRQGARASAAHTIPVIMPKHIAERRLARILLIILLINMMFTLVPYIALVSPKNHGALKIFVKIASKLPFFKSLIEEIIYFWAQKSWRRRVTMTLKKVFYQLFLD